MQTILAQRQMRKLIFILFVFQTNWKNKYIYIYMRTKNLIVFKAFIDIYNWNNKYDIWHKFKSFTLFCGNCCLWKLLIKRVINRRISNKILPCDLFGVTYLKSCLAIYSRLTSEANHLMRIMSLRIYTKNAWNVKIITWWCWCKIMLIFLYDSVDFYDFK